METIVKTQNYCPHNVVTWFLTDPKTRCILCGRWFDKWEWTALRKEYKEAL